jgi:hypothetical protein
MDYFLAQDLKVLLAPRDRGKAETLLPDPVALPLLEGKSFLMWQ